MGEHKGYWLRTEGEKGMFNISIKVNGEPHDFFYHDTKYAMLDTILDIDSPQIEMFTSLWAN